MIAERPDVFNHNVEVVPRLYPRRAPRLALGALAARAAQREGARRGRGRHEVRPDGRPRRDARRDGRRRSATCAQPACRCSPSASTCARPSAICRSCATGTRTSSRRSSRPAYALGFDHIAAGPLVRSQLPRRPARPAAAARRRAAGRARRDRPVTQLAQVNVALPVEPLESDALAGFTSMLEPSTLAPTARPASSGAYRTTAATRPASAYWATTA